MPVKKKKLKPPPKDAICDAYVGVDYSQRTPHILRCHNPATKTVFDIFDVWLCEDCFNKWGK